MLLPPASSQAWKMKLASESRSWACSQGAMNGWMAAGSPLASSQAASTKRASRRVP